MQTVNKTICYLGHDTKRLVESTLHDVLSETLLIRDETEHNEGPFAIDMISQRVHSNISNIIDQLHSCPT